MSDSLIQAAYEINGKAAASDAFYAMACNPAQSVCVEACAGAGKTWMLIERMVKALELGAQPDQILAITFTKKAAGEMRGRLQERLASPELAALRAQVLASGRSVQILTFHAWFAQIFKAAPLSFLQKEGYPLHAELIEQEIELLPELRQIFYAAALADGGLRADLGALIEELGRSNIDDALVGLLAKRTEFELADSQGLIEHSVMDSEPHVLNLAQLAELAKRLGMYKGKKQQTAAGELETALTAGDVVAIKDALLTDKNTRRVLTSKDMSDADVWVLEQAQNDVLKMLAAQHQHVCWLYQQRMTRIGYGSPFLLSSNLIKVWWICLIWSALRPRFCPTPTWPVACKNGWISVCAT
jgi:ATP-dependent helicase/nuclease subunit A